MAFLLKNNSSVAARRAPDGTPPILDQWIRVSRATDTLPATATETLFDVEGGRILLRALVGEVTTAIQAQACNLSVNVDSEEGAAVVLASTLEINADAVGQLYGVEGDGTALITVAGGYSPICVNGGCIIEPGIITLTTSATNTGSVKWDLYYIPLEEGAYVTATAV